MVAYKCNTGIVIMQYTRVEKMPMSVDIKVDESIHVLSIGQIKKVFLFNFVCMDLMMMMTTTTISRNLTCIQKLTEVSLV